MSNALRSALAVASLCCTALPALAEPAADPASECPTFFPDFSCERQGRYEGFIAPMTMPYLFEEPFITTGVSAYGIWHEFPNDSAFQGGDAWVVALQARVAITDRLGLIATKDGVAITHPDDSSQLHDETGLFDISAGLKYALIDRPKDNFILTPSLRFEVPTGQHDVYSGHGDGVAIPAISTGWGIGDFHVLADLGAQLPFTDEQSTSIFYNLHLDYRIWKWLTPFFDLNGMHYTASGNGDINVKTKSFGAVDLSVAQDVLYAAKITQHKRWEGYDVVNLGSEGVAGNDVVTVAFGGRIPITKRVSFGAAYEFPVTPREDIFDQRVTMNVLAEF